MLSSESDDLDWTSRCDCLLKLNRFLENDKQLMCMYSVMCRILNLTFRGLCIVIYSYNKSQQDALFLKFI